MPVISVIICTHNPRPDYLTRVVAALHAQTLPLMDWELLLVDNASDAPLAGRFDLSWHPNARHVREEKTGLTHARLCGIAAAQADLLVFVDDDNVLRADYLQAALKIGADHAWLGAWSGSCIPEFEVEPPAELRPWLAGFVIEKLTNSYWAKILQGGEALPPGAGMVLRRQVAEHYRELLLHDPVRQTLGPRGNQPGSADDSDMALCGFELGLGTGRFPELELTHLIPARKLTLEYLERLHQGFGYSGVLMDAIYKRKQFPGQMKRGATRLFLLWILMVATGRSRTERRIRIAFEKGSLQGMRQLKALNSHEPPPAD